MFDNFFFFQSRAVYEITRNNAVKSDRLQMTTWRVRIACWIPKATYTHSECVILMVFPLQQWLHKRASMLHCQSGYPRIEHGCDPSPSNA
jgi:hypothetical protein